MEGLGGWDRFGVCAAEQRLDHRPDFPFGDDLDLAAIGDHVSGQGGRERAGPVHRAGRVGAFEEPLHVGHRVRVDGHPLTAPLHERLFERRDLPELFGGQAVFAESDLPPELGQRVEPDLRLPVVEGGRVADVEFQSEPLLSVGAELARDAHPESELVEHRADPGQEVPRLLGREDGPVWLGHVERARDRREDPGRFGQGLEQGHVRSHEEPVVDDDVAAVALPDVFGSQHDVRVVTRLEQIAEEPRVGVAVGLGRRAGPLQLVGDHEGAAAGREGVYGARPAGDLVGQGLLDEPGRLERCVRRGQRVAPAELPGGELAVVLARAVLGGRREGFTTYGVGDCVEERPHEGGGAPDGRVDGDGSSLAASTVLLLLLRVLVILSAAPHERVAGDRHRAFDGGNAFAGLCGHVGDGPACVGHVSVVAVDQRYEVAVGDQLDG